MGMDGRTALKSVVVRHGEGIGEERNRLKSLLHDYSCPKREVMWLVHAAELGVVRELRGAGGDTALVVARLTQRLHDDYGADVALARWAIESWAEVLGLQVVSNPSSPRGKQVSHSSGIQAPHPLTSNKAPLLKRDPFETAQEFVARIEGQSYELGEAELLKDQYDIASHRFPIQVVKVAGWSVWAKESPEFRGAYIRLDRDAARALHGAGHRWPLLASLKVDHDGEAVIDRLALAGPHGGVEVVTGVSILCDPTRFVWISPGEFMMGSNDGSSDEKPVHRVVIRKGFWLGKYGVTQGEWESVMGSNPSHFKGNSRLPVEGVCWNDVQDFIRKVNSRTGKRFRLPSEAEWEYGCRAGTTTRYSFGDDERLLGKYGWFDGNSGKQTHPVGEKQPNGWGLYDMHGNVWEWCSDWYDGGYYGKSPESDPQGPSSGGNRVVRGGSWSHIPHGVRSANRYSYTADFRFDFIGYRLVQDN